jgi:uncharacterized RDD family membrane protein YckC
MNTDSSKIQPISYATFFQRTHALLIDFLIFLPLSFLEEHTIFQSKNFSIMVLIGLVWFIYKPLMEWKYGATLGKMAAKIRVVDYSMEFPSFNQSMMRFTPYFAIGLSGLLLHYSLFNMEGFGDVKDVKSLLELQTQNPIGSRLLALLFFTVSVGFIFSDEKNQALHDRLSQTYCIAVKNEKEVEKEPQSFDHFR